jgi:hypothetical protein
MFNQDDLFNPFDQLYYKNFEMKFKIFLKFGLEKAIRPD